MNTWQKRVLTFLVFVLALSVHAFCLDDSPNTPMGMLVFHGSAGLVDLTLLYATPSLLNGKLCDDIQTTCLWSIALNFEGWLLYMAYAPPYIYNTSVWFLNFMQWGRLLVTDENNANYMGRNLVRRSANGRT